MKVYLIKDKGRPITRNFLATCIYNIENNKALYIKAFLLKKDAKKYLKEMCHSEFYEIISATVENKGKDNRRK